MGHQLTVVVLKSIKHVCDGVVDRIGRAVVDIRKVHFLDHGIFFLHESLIHSRHLLEQTHYLGVCDPHVGIRMGGCDIRDDQRT